MYKNKRITFRMDYRAFERFDRVRKSKGFGRYTWTDLILEGLRKVAMEYEATHPLDVDAGKPVHPGWRRVNGTLEPIPSDKPADSAAARTIVKTTAADAPKPTPKKRVKR